MPRKTALPKGLSAGVYHPSFVPKIEQLNEAKFDPDALAQEVEEQLRVRIAEVQESLTNPNRPLTEIEAKALDQKIVELEAAIVATRDRVKAFKNYITGQMKPSGGTEVGFALDIRKKRMLRRAVAQVFGAEVDHITYSMYLEAKEAKRQIEAAEAAEYTSGEWEN